MESNYNLVFNQIIDIGNEYCDVVRVLLFAKHNYIIARQSFLLVALDSNNDFFFKIFIEQRDYDNLINNDLNILYENSVCLTISGIKVFKQRNGTIQNIKQISGFLDKLIVELCEKEDNYPLKFKQRNIILK